MTSTGTGFDLLFLPGVLPFSGVVTGNSGTNGTDIIVNGVALTNSGNNNGWAPIGVPQEWASSYTALQGWTSSSTAKNDPYDSMSARVVAVKRRIGYQGDLVHNAGWINVTPCPLGFATQKAYSNVGAAATSTGQIALYGVDHTQANEGFFVATTPMTLLDYSATPNNPAGNIFTKDTVRVRVETGCEIISKQTGDIHGLVPVPDAGTLLVANASGISASGGSNYTPINIDMVAGGSKPSAAWIIDPTWVGEFVQVTGVTPSSPSATPPVNVSFVIETAICVEYAVAATSLMAPMARGAVKTNMAEVNRVHDLIQSLPVAIPGRQLC